MARTSLITAAAVAGVALAGAAAIGANVGILNAAESTPIGNLSAAGDLLPAEPQVVDVYVDDPVAPTTAAGSSSPTGAPVASAGNAGSRSAGALPAAVAAPMPAAANGPVATSGPNASSQTFAVADAGAVTVGRTSAGLRVDDVVTNTGWSSRLVRVEASVVVVAFSSGARMLELTVTPGPDGSIAGSVADRSVAAPTPTTVAPATTVAPPHEDDDEYEHEYEEPEHEGGDDDD